MQSRLAAGTTLKATVSLPDYPASAGWALRYRLARRDRSGAGIDISAAADGDNHALAVPFATTASWAPGTYTVRAWVEKAGERFEVPAECGELVVTPDPAGFGSGVDGRSQAEVALANVQALLTGKAGSGVESYRIAGRELRSYPLAELLRLESKLKAEVNSEHALAGKAPPYAAGRIQPIKVALR